MKLVVVKEEPLHFHVALKLKGGSRFLPMKQALRNRSGFASHWSTSHTQFWSAVRYLVFTTDRKVTVDSEPLQWTKTGVLMNLYEEAQEPWNAQAIKSVIMEALFVTQTCFFLLVNER